MLFQNYNSKENMKQQIIMQQTEFCPFNDENLRKAFLFAFFPKNFQITLFIFHSNPESAVVS